MVLTVAVLGPVEVRRDGRRLALPSGKTTEVLVRLALDAGRLVHTDRLIEDLWGPAAAGTGKNTLQSKISQLRRALAEPGLVVAAGGGYTLRVAERCVDALHVLRVGATTAAERRSGDAAAALDAATEGLSLFRGEVLVDAGDGDWLRPHRTRLEEVRLALVEDQLAARVDLGAGAEVIAELEWLVDQHPLREGLWSSLITALYRTGRQADALAAYRRVRSVLVEELGIEPGAGLRALEDQVLRQSPSLGAAAAPRPLSVGNLPALSSPLVGRVRDLGALRALTRDRRLVTVVGPAGVGKTRTAIEVARQREPPGGVWLVRLDAADVGMSLDQVVSETLHVPGGEPALLDRLSGAETILLLDNCEHVVDAVAGFASRLLQGATRLRVLATSQVPLGLDGETVYVLAPLPLADSVALFADRASQIRAHFVLDGETAATVHEVCRSLDGLPLAIELAAARVRSLSVHEIARRIGDRFALLHDPTSRRPERRRALAAAIGWSYDLLFPDDQRALWALSAFPGGAPLPGAERVLVALGVPPASALDAMSRLVDRSLADVEILEERSVRYRLLDSVRAFALDRLREAGLVETASAEHASWCADVAGEAASIVRTGRQAESLALVRGDRANIDAALAWAADHDPGLGVRIANGFGWTWVVLGDGVAGAVRVRAALGAARASTTSGEQAAGLLLAGWLEASAGNLEQAQRDLDAALEIAERTRDDRLRADAHRHLAFLRIQQGRPEDVLDLTAAALRVYRRLDLQWDTAGSLLLAAFGAITLGDTTGAARAATEAVELMTPIGDSWALVHADAVLAAIAQAEHRFDDAATSLTRAAAASEQLGFLGQAALHLTTLGRVLQRAGDTARAVDTLDRAISAAGRSGDLRIAATARTTLARLHRAAGETDIAVALLRQNDRWYRDSGGGDGALLTKCLLASMTPEPEGARGDRRLQAVLDEARRCHDAQVEVLALDALALIAAGQGRIGAARDLLGSADDLTAHSGHVIDPSDRIDAHRARSLIPRPRARKA